MFIQKFIFCCIFLSLNEAFFFACCSCPPPFRSSGCQQQQPQQPYQPIRSSFVAQPIVVENPSQLPQAVEKHFAIPYHGSYDPFEPIQIHEVYVPVIYRPRPIYSRPSGPPPSPSYQEKPMPPKKEEKDDACYVNDSGFKCCNTDLENTMHGAYSALKNSPSFNECNIGLMSKVVQKASQKKFRLSFEVVVSLKMFGSNSAYEGNYTCRFERDGKHFMSYASPTQYDTENAKSESTLSNTDLTHDEDDIPPTEQEKEKKIEDLNEGLKDIKSTGKKIKERIRRAASNGVPAFIQNNCIIEFNKINSSESGAFVTHEITMGSLSSATLSRQKRPSSQTC